MLRVSLPTAKCLKYSIKQSKTGSILTRLQNRHFFRAAHTPRQSDKEGERAVRIALLGNVSNAVIKFGAYWATGSSSMYSEGLHSVADCMTQLFLLVGIHTSRMAPTASHPHGFKGSVFVSAIVSAIIGLGIGGAISIWTGIAHLMTQAPVVNIHYAFLPLVLNCIIELNSARAGYIAVKQGAKETGMTIKEYVVRGPSPLGVAVLAEDGGALLGIVVAFVVILATHLTGNFMFDAIGSIAIGMLQITTSILLVAKNFAFLFLRSIPKMKLDELVECLLKDESVSYVKRATGVQLGPDAIWFKAEVEFNAEQIAEKAITKHPELQQELEDATKKGDVESVKKISKTIAANSVDSVGDEVDRLEKLLLKKNSQLKYIDLENN